MTSNAKILYSILLDRMNLSAKNSWFDEEGRVFIIFTIHEIVKSINCSERKAVQLMNELEDIGLIERKKQGLCKPNLIYVKNFISVLQNVQFRKCRNYTSRGAEDACQEMQKMQSINTEMKKPDYRKTDTIHPSDESMDGRMACKQYFIEQLEFECLKQENPYERESLEEILELLVDTVCSNNAFVRIGGEKKEASVVKSQFMKLDKGHIDYVLMCMKENTTKVKNIRSYLLTALFYAPLTISNYYTALVNNDMATGKI